MPKRIAGVLLAIAGAALPLAAQQAEASPRPKFSFETAAVSQYLWRGFLVNDSPSLQPSLTATYRGLSVNLWSNVSRTGAHHKSWTESDITVEYGRSIGKLALVAGFTDYQFVDTPAADGNRSAEFYLGCSLPLPLSPSLRVYRDIERGKGSYYSASIVRGFRLPRRLRASTTLGIGLNQHQFQEHTTISNVESTTAVELFNNERLVVSPFVTVIVGNRNLFGTHAAFGLRLAVQP